MIGTVGDTKIYEASNGQNREALGVVILGDDGTPLPIGTDRSGTITTGGTSQQLAAANPDRKSLFIQNLSAGDLYINEVGVAASAAGGSYRLTAGQAFAVATNAQINVLGATTGQAWVATEI